MITRRRIVRFIYERRRPAQQALRLVFRRPVPIALPEFTILVRLDDWAVGARIAVHRHYEPHVTHALRARLRPGMVVVDVGANIGYHSLLAARHVGATGTVIAFEPGADNLQLLEASAEINGFRQIRTHRLAVSDGDGEVWFRRDDSNGVVDRGDLGPSAIRVPAVTLDHRLRDEPRIDLIKIDVEGAEGRVVRGMAALLDRHRPSLVTEFSPDALPQFSGMTAQGFLDLLRQHRYDLRVIPHRGSIRAAPQDDFDILRAFEASGSDHLDLVATPRE
jgi:FkbM family methyltransferase